jgi:transposase
MFIYVRKLSRKRASVVLQESIRVNGKVKTRVIKYFGIAHGDEELKKLKQKAYTEKRKHKPKQKKKKIEIESLTEKDRVTEGFHDVFERIFDELGIQSCFSKVKYNQLKDVVIARMASPVSKLHTSKILKKDFQKSLSEDQIYHLMDKMIEKEAEIKEKIFEATQKFSPEKPINILFFDVTTLYFESQKSDELKEFGYSKDGKKGEVQVVLALATNEQGLPIGYHLFPGNTAEVKTLLQSLSTWEKIVPIKNMRVIADRAMMSENNLSQIEESNNQYVVAAKLKMVPKILKTEILRMHEKTNSSEHFIEEFVYKNRRLIVEYSPQRAIKDKADRERLIKKIKSKIGIKTTTKKLVTNNGYLKYMDEEKKGKVVFNEKKVKEEELWDGLHGIITNDFEANAKELLAQYKRLWIIEESFRINKHSLSMRPIYHYTSKRIKAHILICYLAFSLYRSLQMKLKLNNLSISLERLREELNHVQASVLEDPKTGKMYRMPSLLSKEMKLIYKMLEIHRSNKASVL